MMLNYKIRPEYQLDVKDYLDIIENFGNRGTTVDDRGRNVIKKFKIRGLDVNAKSFKPPHLINSFVYMYFRKSKARRSYEYALELLARGIKSPDPLAYFEFHSLLGLGKSFYFSRQLLYDYTFYDLRDNYKDRLYQDLLRQFARFAFELHEKGVYHKDLSAGNILITCVKNISSFYLIDLNRMKFVDLDLDLRMKNLSRLSEEPEVLKIIAEEYAKVSGWTFEEIYDKMNYYTAKFRKKYNLRMDLKRRLLGRKNS